MYKVFFNERTVVLTDDFIRNFQMRYGLFYKYRSVEDLKEILSLYWEIRKIDTLFVYHNDLDQLRERFKSCFQLVYAAGGLIRNKKNQYLIMKRRGKWDLPKGKLNKNETVEAAAVREVTEETGLFGIAVVSPLLSTYHTYYIDSTPVLKKTSWFEMLYMGDDEPIPELEEDITEIIWVKKSELGSIVNNTYLAIIDVFRYGSLL
ncbi:MAG TPA: NUDIX domain-containing protein [Bacteroidales bacterium]|jgi:8-oxo-dGTP pyrophosphatase MutT (NUDIX family)|nr:NUDIX domain-containing protein [Bacteroidales bacterium]